jgi:uncharacterized membrane-anchored protein YhcB (DUF1043 family)
MSETPITKEGKSLRSTFAVVSSFIVVIIIIFNLFIEFGVIPQYSAIAGLVAGAFVVFIIMAMNDITIVSLKEKIENVQNDVKESKREIGGQIIALNHNIQSIHSRIDSVMTNINLSTNMAIAKQNSTMNVYFVRALSEEIAKQENVEKEIEKETTRIPTKKEIESFVALLMRFSKKSTQDKGEAGR